MCADRCSRELVSIFEALEPRLLLSASSVGVMTADEVRANFADVLFYDPAPDLAILQAEAEYASSATAEAAAFPLDQTFFLHSAPGASKVIYLDFDGHTTSNTEWNTQFTNGNDFTTPAFSYQGDSSFSDAEKERIQGIWMRVAEDYLPFDVDVTTEEPGSAALLRSGASDTQWGVRMVIGGNSNDWFAQGAGGVAYVGSFTWGSDTPAFVFPENLATAEKYIAEATTHEAGHALDLSHDGTNSVEYYDGHGSGATGWAPVMGVGYYQELVQWSKGEYSFANNGEDDLAIIVGSNGFGYRSDDHGNATGLASTLNANGTGIVFDEGIIERNTDLDYFEFFTATGEVNLSVDPFGVSPNLDILASLYDSTGALVTTSNPLAALEASFNLVLSPGMYYIGVEGIGKDPLSSGYSDYGSLGYYSISGSIGGPDVTDIGLSDADIDFDIATPSDNDTVTISATVGNLGNTDLTDVAVRFYDGDPGAGGVQIGSDYIIVSLGGISAGVAQVVWTPGSGGQHDIYVIVDPDNAIEEQHENNNTAHKSIFVSDNDTDGPEIYNVVITEHNGDGDGIIAADEQIRISWELTDSIARGLLITEVSTGDENFVEIQNVWDQSADASGWTVLLNYSPDVSVVNSHAWTLGGSVAPGEVLYRTEDPAAGANYLGGAIEWENDGPGWVMLIDDSGVVKDFAAWGYTSAEIAGMSIDYGGFTGITPGAQWSGDGAEIGADPVAPPLPVAGAIVYTGGTYVENFNSMGSSGTETPQGWITGDYTVRQDHDPPGSAPRDETLTVDNGSDRGGGSYNYGTTGDSDRALGNITGKDDDRAIQLAVTNDTGAEITALNLTYTGEQWRDVKTNASLPQLLTVWFSTDPGSGFASMGGQFSFIAPSNKGLNSAIDGNDAANRTVISGVYTPDTPIPDGQTFYITWHDQDETRGDHGLAVDDVSLIPEYEPPNTILERTGHSDNNTAVDFVRTSDSTPGAQNPGLVDSSGIGPVELLVDGAPVTLGGDYYAIVGPLDSNGPDPLGHSFTINAGDGDNSPTYTQLVASFDVAASEEITVLRDGSSIVSGQAAPIDFGQIDQGQANVEIVFEIRNDGAQALTLGEITAPSGFAITPPLITDLAAGGSTFFSVTLDTSVAGLFGGNVTIVSSDGAQSPDALDENPFEFAVSGTISAPASIVARHVFYNNSAFDTPDGSKSVLLPGEIAGPENYTNYHLGINGIMIDIDALGAALTAADFNFMVNAADAPDTWTTAPTPTVSVQSGGGVDGSDRVTLIWFDGEIVNRWLKVTVLSGANTALGSDDVFYIGNAVGDTDGDGRVDGADFGILLSEFGASGSLGALGADVDASGWVDLSDFVIMRASFDNIVQAPAAPMTPALAPVFMPQITAERPADLLAEFTTQRVSPPTDNNFPLDTPLILSPLPDLFVSPQGSALPAASLQRVSRAPEDLLALNDYSSDADDELAVDILLESMLIIRL